MKITARQLTRLINEARHGARGHNPALRFYRDPEYNRLLDACTALGDKYGYSLHDVLWMMDPKGGR